MMMLMLRLTKMTMTKKREELVVGSDVNADKYREAYGTAARCCFQWQRNVADQIIFVDIDDVIVVSGTVTPTTSVAAFVLPRFRSVQMHSDDMVWGMPRSCTIVINQLKRLWKKWKLVMMGEEEKPPTSCPHP